VQERKLKKQLALSYSLPFASLESGIKSLRTEIIEELKKTPSYPHLVPLQDILAWISSLQLPIEIDRVEYELIDYPKEKRNTPYQGQLSLIFQASSPSVVSAVIKELQKNPSYVQQKDELKWTLHPQGYKISFLLQNSSLPQSIDGNLFPSESR
jgi:hypothetical protein